MITKIQTVNKLTDLFLSVFLSLTNKVTKVSPNSLVKANARGVAKLSQKILVQQALLESNVFPEAAVDSDLDAIALREGYPARFAASASGTFLRLVGTAGITYTTAMNFTGNHGIVFNLISNVTIGADGFAFGIVMSSTTGIDSNVEANTITTLISPPSGHKYVTNDVRTMGGKDAEDDDTFRKRLMGGVNLLSQGTIAAYEQAAMKINGRLLRFIKGGTSTAGKLILYAIPVDGVDFTVATELPLIESGIVNMLSITDYMAGLEVKNALYYPIDITLRCSLKTGADADLVRANMQIGMQKILDFRYWEDDDIIEWDDLFLVAKTTVGVEQILDNYFYPNVDVKPPYKYLPRIRSFIMLDLDGNLVTQGSGNLNPLYFPNKLDYVFQQTVLRFLP